MGGRRQKASTLRMLALVNYSRQIGLHCYKISVIMCLCSCDDTNTRKSKLPFTFKLEIQVQTQCKHICSPRSVARPLRLWLMFIMSHRLELNRTTALLKYPSLSWQQPFKIVGVFQNHHSPSTAQPQSWDQNHRSWAHSPQKARF